MSCYLNSLTGCPCEHLRGAARRRTHAMHLREHRAMERDADDMDADAGIVRDEYGFPILGDEEEDGK